MNKRGHLQITGQLFIDAIEPYRFWLLLGSILPDLLFYTYLTGHTWKTSFIKLQQKMTYLAQHGRNNRRSCLCLGYMLHYIEDYFTYPHNQTFHGTLREHCRYEEELSERIMHSNIASLIEGGTAPALSTEEIIQWLENTHNQYLERPQGYENDLIYIPQAAEKVVGHFLTAFQQNEMLYAKKRFAQTGLHYGYFFFGRQRGKL